MPEPSSSVFPLRPANTGSDHTVSYTNPGSGIQNNYLQIGGHGNIQYNAGHQTFNYHGRPHFLGKQSWNAICTYTEYLSAQSSNRGVSLDRPLATMLVTGTSCQGWRTACSV
jgi:hypothetical protein